MKLISRIQQNIRKFHTAEMSITPPGDPNPADIKN